MNITDFHHTKDRRVYDMTMKYGNEYRRFMLKRKIFIFDKNEYTGSYTRCMTVKEFYGATRKTSRIFINPARRA